MIVKLRMDFQPDNLLSPFIYWTSSLPRKPEMSCFMFCVTKINNMVVNEHKFAEYWEYECLPLEKRNKCMILFNIHFIGLYINRGLRCLLIKMQAIGDFICQ